WIIIGVVAFLLVIQSKVAILSFIPGAFCGAAVTAWAAPTDSKGYVMVAVALVAGAVLGYVSEVGAGMIAKKALPPKDAEFVVGGGPGLARQADLRGAWGHAD